MNAVGIDVSKGKSTVTVLQPFGVVIAEPFEVLHTADELKKLVTFIKSLSGETKVVSYGRDRSASSSIRNRRYKVKKHI